MEVEEKFKRGDRVVYKRFNDEHIECVFGEYCYEFFNPCLVIFPVDGSNYFLAPPSKVFPVESQELRVIDSKIAYHEAAIKRLQERRREEINRQNLNKVKA